MKTKHAAGLSAAGRLSQRGLGKTRADCGYDGFDCGPPEPESEPEPETTCDCNDANKDASCTEVCDALAAAAGIAGTALILVIVLPIVGCLLVILLIVLIACCCCKKKPQQAA